VILSSRLATKGHLLVERVKNIGAPLKCVGKIRKIAQSTQLVELHLNPQQNQHFIELFLHNKILFFRPNVRIS
jgi:hypothetical protein